MTSAKSMNKFFSRQKTDFWNFRPDPTSVG